MAYWAIPGELSSTRRNSIGIAARFSTVTSIVTGAVEPEPKKISCVGSTRRPGCGTFAGRALCPLLHAIARKRTTEDRRRIINLLEKQKAESRKQKAKSKNPRNPSDF